jgi:hypothetical protein
MGDFDMERIKEIKKIHDLKENMPSDAKRMTVRPSTK